MRSGNDHLDCVLSLCKNVQFFTPLHTKCLFIQTRWCSKVEGYMERGKKKKMVRKEIAALRGEPPLLGGSVADDERPPAIPGWGCRKVAASAQAGDRAPRLGGIEMGLSYYLLVVGLVSTNSNDPPSGRASGPNGCLPHDLKRCSLASCSRSAAPKMRANFSSRQSTFVRWVTSRQAYVLRALCH